MKNRKIKALQMFQLNNLQSLKVPEAGLEPARRLRAKDFESFVSTISPLGLIHPQR